MINILLHEIFIDSEESLFYNYNYLPAVYFLSIQFQMYFARYSENFMSVGNKYFHFVFTISVNTSCDFYKSYRRFQAKFFCLQSLPGRSLLHQGDYFAQSPSSLDSVIVKERKAFKK